jgi:hypothetical protein
MTSLTLNRFLGGTTTLQTAQLETVMAHLAAGSQNEAAANNLLYFRGEPGLLVADALAPVIRQLMLAYTPQPAMQFDPPIGFQQGELLVSLVDALRSSGTLIPPGEALADTLSNNYMVYYQGVNPFMGPKGDKGDPGDSIQGPPGESITGPPGPPPSAQDILNEVDAWGNSQQGAAALAPLVNTTATSWLTTNQDVLKSTEPGPPGASGLNAPSIANVSVEGTDLHITLTDGNMYSVPLDSVLAQAVSTYLAANPVSGGLAVTAASVNAGGLLTLTLSDSSTITADFATYVNAALAALPTPLSSASLADTVLLLTTSSGPVSVDLASLKGDTITSVSLADKALVINTNTPSVFNVDLSAIGMPTLQQFETDAAATAALTAGSLYYDSTGFVKVVLPVVDPLIPFTTSNMVFSQNPEMSSPWDSVSKTLQFNRFGTASGGNIWGSWALSDSLLSSLNFNRAGSWCFAVKFKSAGNNLRCLLAFDPAMIDDWVDDSGMYDEISVPDLNNRPPYVYIRSSGQLHTAESLTAPNVLIPNINVDTEIASAQGCFALWSYDNAISQLKVEFFSTSGATVYTSTRTYTFRHQRSPIAFYSDMDGFDFLKGLYYSPSYQPFSVWSQYF